MFPKQVTAGSTGISRRNFAGSLLAGTAFAARSKRPANVIFLLTDDHGAWATSAYGCADMQTPNMSKLKREGTLFQNAFAATPVCSPSRATWLTGLMPSSHGIQDWLRPADSFGPNSRNWLSQKLTFSEVLAGAGYTLGMCGKWHMGHDESPQAGFSYWATVPGGGGPYRDAEFVHNSERKVVPGFKEDALTDFALEFVEQNRQRPFFLYVPFYAPHTPYNYQPPGDRDRYAGSQFSCFPDEPVNPHQVPSLRGNHGKRESKLSYSALISAADRNIGRLLTRVDELGLAEDTLVIFSADQGWNAGHHGVWGKGNGTVPLNMYEESIRVPLIWRHPGKIQAGRSASPLVSNYDFFPTLLDYLGIARPKPDHRRVGTSYAGFLRGIPPARWRDRLYFEYAYTRAVRTAKHKYITRTAPYAPAEMYDLSTDPQERTDVSGEKDYRALGASLKRDLEKFFQAIGAPVLADWQSTTEQKLTVDTVG